MATSSDILPILTEDSRISDIKSQLNVSALVGARDNSYYTYAATTSSKNSVTVNCSLPSENVVFDRLIFIRAKVNFVLYMSSTNAGPTADTLLFEYGKTCAFQPFPLNGLISNANVKVNSVSFNMSSDDIQNILLRTQDLNDLMKSNMCMSPSYPDQVLDYGAADYNNLNNPLAAYNKNVFSSLVSRGAHPLDSAVFEVDLNGAGSWTPVNQDQFKAGVANQPNKYRVTFSATFQEPLLLSPFIFSSKKFSKAGLTNVTNLSFNFTLDPLLRNVWSQLPIANLTVSNTSVYTLSLADTPLNDFSVLIQCLTPHITQPLPPVSILPCHSYERYISSSNTSELNANATADVVLNNLVLSQIPELMYIAVRKPQSSSTYLDAKSYFSINSCAINFMNSQGLLSGANQEILYKISKENGYADSWYQWSGKAYAYNDATHLNENYFTSGSILIVNPAKDLSISNVYLTNGSRGQYNLQLKLNVTNRRAAKTACEVIIICKYGCYLKNYPGGKSTLTAGYFDMSMLSNVVTQAKPEMSNSDIQVQQGNSISDTSIGEIDKVASFEGNGYKGRGGRVGAGKSMKSKICL